MYTITTISLIYQYCNGCKADPRIQRYCEILVKHKVTYNNIKQKFNLYCS